ncbi:MAG: hypothetical protein NWP80_01050 [Candidatus Gracilibacteria bacterium]|nr:hypothetical protein [Candidatus Gracilibacteria bacterium]
MLFHTDKKYYPMPQVYDNTAGSENLWGYDDSLETTSSNKIQVVYNGQEIDSIVDTTTNGGGKLEVTNTDDSLDYQIGAKGVIGYNGEFNKTYLSKELYDPELGDTKVGANKMIDYGIGKYVYGVYALPKVSNWNVSGSSGSYYNIATTIKKAGSELYETYIVGNYDENSCSLPGFDTCPKTLIGDLENGTIQSTSTGTQDDNQGIPYPIRDFNQ